MGVTDTITESDRQKLGNFATLAANRNNDMMNEIIEEYQHMNQALGALDIVRLAGRGVPLDQVYDRLGLMFAQFIAEWGNEPGYGLEYLFNHDFNVDGEQFFHDLPDPEADDPIQPQILVHPNVHVNDDEWEFMDGIDYNEEWGSYAAHSTMLHFSDSYVDETGPAHNYKDEAACECLACRINIDGYEKPCAGNIERYTNYLNKEDREFIALVSIRFLFVDAECDYDYNQLMLRDYDGLLIDIIQYTVVACINCHRVFSVMVSFNETTLDEYIDAYEVHYIRIDKTEALHTYNCACVGSLHGGGLDV